MSRKRPVKRDVITESKDDSEQPRNESSSELPLASEVNDAIADQLRALLKYRHIAQPGNRDSIRHKALRDAILSGVSNVIDVANVHDESGGPAPRSALESETMNWEYRVLRPLLEKIPPPRE